MQPNPTNKRTTTLIEKLMSEAHVVRDCGDSYPKESENCSYVSDFGGFAAIFAALNINVLSVSYEPAPQPRRIYATDVPGSISSADLACQRTTERSCSSLSCSSHDDTSEQLHLDASSSRITFLIEFKARVVASDYSTQLKWVKFPVTVPIENFDDDSDYVYGQIIDQVLQAREMLSTPSIWASLTRLERGE